MYKVKTAALLLLVLMTTVACGPACSTNPGSLASINSFEDAVVMTVAARAEQQPTLSVDEIVALTVAASAPADTAAENPKSGSDTGATPADTAAPAAPDAPTVAQPAAVANQPQLRANQNANVRNGPGVNYGIIGSLRLNDTVDVVAKNRDESWYLVSYGAQDVYLTGNPQITHFWVSHSVTDPVNAADMAKVQVAATIPAPPTSTPTATAKATTAATSTATATTTSGGGSTSTPHGNSPTHTPTPAVTLISPTAVPSNIEVYNNSGTYVCYVLTAASGESYGSNHLNGELAPGNSLYITYPDAGPYELYAQECEGYDDLYWAEYNIFNDFYWELGPQ